MKKRYIFIIIAIILIVIAIKFIIDLNNPKTEEKYNGNLMNMGLAIKDGENIYYDKYPEGIYKIDKNGEETLIIDDLAYSINIQKDWIFYVTLGESYKLDIIKIKKDGTEKSVIANINSIYTSIYVEDEWVYYLNNENEKNYITKISISGEKKNKISETPVQNFQVTKNYIYYTDLNNRIRRMNLDGSKDKELAKAETAKSFQVTGDYIYYIGINSNRLERINLKNNKSQLVSSEVVAEHFNVVDNIIYYYNNGMIYSLNVENMEIKDIVKINGGDTFINVVDDKIFYLDDLQIYKININGKNS